MKTQDFQVYVLILKQNFGKFVVYYDSFFSRSISHLFSSIPFFLVFFLPIWRWKLCFILYAYSMTVHNWNQPFCLNFLYYTFKSQVIVTDHEKIILVTFPLLLYHFDEDLPFESTCTWFLLISLDHFSRLFFRLLQLHCVLLMTLELHILSKRLCKRKITFSDFFPLPFGNSFYLDSTAVCLPECDLPVSSRYNQLLLLHLVLEIKQSAKFIMFYIFLESNFPRYITGFGHNNQILLLNTFVTIQCFA